MAVQKITNPDLVTVTTLDDTIIFTRPIQDDTEVLIEAVSGTLQFAVGENSNNSAATYTAGQQVILTISNRPQNQLHASASSLTGSFKISF